MANPTINEQIKEFGVHWIFCGKLQLLPTIKKSDDYSHWLLELHHYIREQMYYRNPERFKNKQKLILLPKQMHKDLHSGMRDATFYNKWKIKRDILLFRHRKVEYDA